MFGFDGRQWAVEVTDTTVAGLCCDGRRVLAYAEEPTPPGACQGGAVREPEALSAVMRRLLGGLGRQGGAVRLALRSADVIERVLTIPLLPSGKLDAAVRTEVRRQTAVALEQVYVRWARVARAGGYVVYVALVLRAALESQMEALKRASYVPVHANLQSLGFMRGLGVKDGFFVHQSADGMLSMTLAVDGVPLMSFAQVTQGGEVIGAIEQALVIATSSIAGKSGVDAPAQIFIHARGCKSPELRLKVYLLGGAARPEIGSALREGGYDVAAELIAPVSVPAAFPLGQRAALLGCALA